MSNTLGAGFRRKTVPALSLISLTRQYDSEFQDLCFVVGFGYKEQLPSVSVYGFQESLNITEATV